VNLYLNEQQAIYQTTKDCCNHMKCKIKANHAT